MSAGLFFAVFFVSIAATKAVLVQLRQRAMFDVPNSRSSHQVPTPRGGGIAILAIFLPATLALVLAEEIPTFEAATLAGLATLLAAVCWIDDVRDLNPAVRLGVHVATVAIAMIMGLVDGPVFGGLLPRWIDQTVAVLLWIWFINLFNFMDGIDGFAAVETITIGIGVALVSILTQSVPFPAIVGVVLAGAAGGFLIWNWHPAKIFMGDVGSVPCGFVLGWVLLNLAASGYWMAALILPAYFIVDASFTLGKRLLRGDRVWRAHREHFYQYAIDQGRSHASVSTALAVTNGILMALAITVMPGFEFWSMGGAIFAVGALIFWMRSSRSASNSENSS